MTKRETERVSDERLEQIGAGGGLSLPECRMLARELQERRRTPDGRDEVIEECAKVVDDFNAQGSALATTTVALMLVAQELRALKKDHP